MAVAGLFLSCTWATFVLKLSSSCGFSNVFCEASAQEPMIDEMLALALPGENAVGCLFSGKILSSKICSNIVSTK
eukprot:13388598-Ditylum_brightwellii.AAC.1